MLLLNEMKPLGAFIENTVRPILAELRLCKADLTLSDLEEVLTKLAITHTICLVFSVIKDISITLIIGWVICKTQLL